MTTRILLVEDEDIVAALIGHTLRAKGYALQVVGDGEQAWRLLQQDQDFHILILDRQLPGLDGLSLLQRIKQHPGLHQIPVIMETGMDDTASIREGLAAGAYYYLTKPLDPQLLLAVVEAALNQDRDFKDMHTAIQEAEQSLHFIDSGIFSCRTLEEARLLAKSLAHACPQPERVVTGLQELLVNAVEHGNLGITYRDKTRLLLEGRWQEEVARRQEDSCLGRKRVRVALERSQEQVSLTIEDEGDGFDWQDYLEFSPQRAFDPHGRGIAMARLMSFDGLEYQGKGNRVRATLHRKKSVPA